MPCAGEERAVRERVLEVARDQDRVELVRPRSVTMPTASTTGMPWLASRRSSVLLAPRRPFRQLLQRVERAVVLDEPHDMAADAADQIDDPVGLPFLERLRPTAGRGSSGGRCAPRAGTAARSLLCWIVELSNACTPPGLAITVLCLICASA